MYTNQCFHKYPHFQLSELNENKKYSNNSNRFRSSSPGKGKQTKGKGNNRNHKWRDGKGKRGNQNQEGNKSSNQGQRYTQNSTQAKGKGAEKGSKGKGKNKGKPRYGDRKSNWKEDKNHQDKETKPVTNNMQKVYFGNQHCLGDDETTIVFTNNSTRIITNIEKGNNEDDNEDVDENNVTREYERLLSIELAPTFAGMIKEVMNLPDDHEAWAYMNPTMYFFGNQTSNLLEQKAQYVIDFQNWLDGTLFINHELKERTKSYNLTQPPQEENIQVAAIEENLNLQVKEEQGSSSVEEKPFEEITWGTRKALDNEDELNSWLRTNIPSAEKRNGDKNDESNLEEMTLCSVCEKEMFTFNTGINTCE
jgi:hypothetical protein